jgi:8-oxo-dGTP pyrophosphatase MutT (NUDIX family)
MTVRSQAEAHPAATVVLLRDGADGGEVLLVRRSERLTFHGGAWVFPGGRIDPQDYAAVPDTGDILSAARVAAAREAWEEAGVVVEPSDLVVFTRWVTPALLPKRFDAWFFVGRACGDGVRVDGGEIQAHCWMRPGDALAAQRAGGMDLPPPTFVTLDWLSRYRTADEMVSAVAGRPVETFVPRLYTVDGGACTLYAGDAGYETGDLQCTGPRHRLWMVDSGWRYERG